MSMMMLMHRKTRRLTPELIADSLPEGAICGEGIYPRWVAKRPPRPAKSNELSGLGDCFAADRG
jgi:hypothetical protein